MNQEKREELKKFMYWLADYKGWENVKTVQLLNEYQLYLDGKA